MDDPEKQLAVLQALSGVTSGAQAPSGIGSILGRDLLNLPGAAVNSLVGGVNDFLNLGAPEGEKPAPWQVPNVVDSPIVNEQSSGVERIAHLITAGLAPKIAALAVPYVGATKVGRAIGLGAKGAGILGDLGAAALSGADRGAEGIAEDSAMFVGTHLALSGLGKVVGALRKKPVANLQIGREIETPTIAVDEIIPPRNRTALRLPQQSADVSGPVINIPGRVAGPVVDDLGMAPPDSINNVLTDLPFDLELNRIPKEVHPTLIPRPIMMERGQLPVPNPIVPVEQISNPKMIGLKDLEIQQDFAKSKIADLPEYRRTEGGNAILNTLLLSGLSGAAGGAIGGKIGGTDNSVALGIGAGLIAPWMGAAALERLLRPAEAELSPLFKAAQESGMVAGPAFKLPNGEVISRRGAKSHFELVEDVPNTVPPSQIERGFIDERGEYMTAHEANAEALFSGQISKKTFEEGNKTKVLGLTTEDIQPAESIRTPFNSESGSVGGGGGKKLPVSSGTSNLSATVEKNIADAKMMNPEHPEVFLRQMATMAAQKGNHEAAANFEAAIANLQKKSLNEIDAFHGTDTDIVTFDNSKIGSKAPSIVQGHFFTKDAEHASEFGEKVIPVTLKLKNPKVIDAEGRNIRAVLGTYEEGLARDEGYDGFIVKNVVDTRGYVMSSAGYSSAKPRDIYVAFDSGQITVKDPKFKLKLNNDAANTSIHTLLPLAGAGLGAVAGYREDGLEGAATLAIVGGTLGLLGARGLDRLQLTGPKTGAKAAATTVKSSVEKGLKAALDSPAKDLGGQDVYGRGGIIPKFFRAAESLFNYGLPAELHSTITRARGFASEIIDHATTALKSAVKFNPPDEIQEITNKFLNGKLLDDAAFLKENGAVTEQAFSRLNSTQKEGLSSWTRLEKDANGKDVAVKYYTKPAARDEFLTLSEQNYLKSVPEDWHEFANLQITMRRSMNQFQKLIGDALPEGNLKEKILDSIGRYVPRMYRIFGDNKYHVTDQQIEAASVEFGLSKSKGEIESAIAQKQARPAEDHNKLIAELSGKKDMQSQIRLERLSKFVPTVVDGKAYFAQPEIAESLLKFGNEDYLKNEVKAYLADIKTNREVYGVAKGIDKTLFMEREEIGASWRDMLGEYTDPTERMAMGLEKMYAPSQAAKLISTVKDMEIDGLPISLSGDSWAAMNTKLKAANDITNLQKLNGYKKLASDIKYGEYSGLYVHRFLADYFANDSRVWESSLGRHMASFNKLFKTTHVPLNPVSQLRQIFSMPVFALIGRATPASMGQAWEAWKSVSSELKSELIREGIWTADFIRGELSGNISTIMNGRYDSSLVSKLKKGYEGILEAYRVPDMLTRGGAYISAKNRIARELGKELSDPEVIAKAVEWTDKYTMNYDNVSRAVRVARNIPFVNPFISFQAEILRIMKNLAMDSSKGNIERLATLGGIIAAPEIAMKTAEGSLSAKDRKEWEKMKGQLPPYMRDTSLLPIAKLQNGKFKYVSISPIVPHDNFAQGMKAIAQGDGEAFWSINPFLSSDKSPLFNLITEAVTGESRQSGLKYRNTREQLMSMVSEVLPPLSPGGYEWNKLANVNVENLRSGKVENWGDLAFRYTTGLSSGVLKPDAVLKSAQGKLKSEIANLRSYYLQVAKTTSPDEVKAKAYNQYKQGVELLIHDFAERFAQ